MLLRIVCCHCRLWADLLAITLNKQTSNFVLNVNHSQEQWNDEFKFTGPIFSKCKRTHCATLFEETWGSWKIINSKNWRNGELQSFLSKVIENVTLTPTELKHVYQSCIVVVSLSRKQVNVTHNILLMVTSRLVKLNHFFLFKSKHWWRSKRNKPRTNETLKLKKSKIYKQFLRESFSTQKLVQSVFTTKSRNQTQSELKMQSACVTKTDIATSCVWTSAFFFSQQIEMLIKT